MVPEITPAKLTKKTEDYQAGGMPGSVCGGSWLRRWRPGYGYHAWRSGCRIA
ncbi:phage major tail tube protein [Escherichia coli]|uniref:phage major tail tube protein n=1 Tax=Escherichia coli TaxID=562 RepID=UPI003D9C7C01